MKNPQRNYSIMVRTAMAVGVVVLLTLVAPLLFLMVQAGLAMIAIGVTAVFGIAMWKAIPLLGQKWENKVLGLRKAEARENPIEQLQNFWLSKAKQVSDFKVAVGQIGSQVRGMSDMIEERKRTRPGADVSKQQQSLEAMRKAHAVLLSKYENAEKALEELKHVIDDKKFDWQFSQAGQKAIASMNATNGQELMNQMLADEAFSSVRDNFNQVFAELDMEVGRLNSAKELTFEGGLTLDVSAIRIPDLQRA